MEQRVGTDKLDGPVLEQFTGVDLKGDKALVMRTEKSDFAQYNDLEHPKAFGWWQFTLGTFAPVEPTDAR